MVLDSSDTIFFPVKTFLRFFLTSLLKITWKKKMKMPCEVKRETFGVKTAWQKLVGNHLLASLHLLQHLQTAADGEQVVEDHHVAVDRHQAKEPGGADEQQQEESHSKGRAEGGRLISATVLTTVS